MQLMIIITFVSFVAPAALLCLFWTGDSFDAIRPARGLDCWMIGYRLSFIVNALHEWPLNGKRKLFVSLWHSAASSSLPCKQLDDNDLCGF